LRFNLLHHPLKQIPNQFSWKSQHVRLLHSRAEVATAPAGDESLCFAPSAREGILLHHPRAELFLLNSGAWNLRCCITDDSQLL
jgi:hypothetical protein